MKNPAAVQIYLLGQPIIESEGTPIALETRKAVALLARLAADRREHGRSSLVALLWPESDESHGRGALRRTLHAITKNLPVKSLIVEHDTIGLGGVETVWTDVDELTDAHRRVIEQVSGGVDSDGGENIQLLRNAVELYRGDFLSGFALKDCVEFDDWRYFFSEELRRKYIGCLSALISLLRGVAEYEGALGYATRWLALDNLDEAPQRETMELYSLLGNRAAAVRQFEMYRTAIDSEIGEEPSKDMMELSRRIRTDEFPADIPETHSHAIERSLLKDEITARVDLHPGTLLAVRLRGDNGQNSSDALFMSSLYGLALRYGGRIDRYVGNTVLIVFGRTATAENAPELAIRAAIDMRGIAERFDMPMTCAISSGVINTPISNDYSIMWRPLGGPAVNEVLKMAAARKEPGIFVSETIFRTTRHAAAYSHVSRSGKQANIYNLVSLLDTPAKTRGIDGRRASLIGRARELATLRTALLDVTEGHGRIVTMEGTAGVGKSRLVAEAAGALDSSEEIIVLEGRCLDLGVAAGYWPLIDMFRHLIGIRPEETDADRTKNISLYIQKAARSHPEILIDPVEITHFISLLLSTTGLPVDNQNIGLEDPERVRYGVFSAVRQLFFGIAQNKTLILLFEDLHWADALSLDFISFLIDSFGEDEAYKAPFLGLICLYRPEQDHRCRHLSDIAHRKFPRGHTHIALKELSRDESLRLIKSLLGTDDVPQELPEGIFERTQGNPFFIEEFVRGFVETGVIDDEKSTIDVDSGGGAVPAGVERVIRGTTDRLPDSLQIVLRGASVIGRVFDDTVLAGVIEDPDGLKESLGALEDRGLIYEERSVPRREYSFRHVLTRDAIYAGIPTEEKISLHRRAAETIERVFDERLDPFLERLAYHYECAGDEGAAVQYLHAAGQKAVRASDNVAAQILLERALVLVRGWRRGASRANIELALLVTLGIPVTATTGYGSLEARRVFQRANDLFSADDRSADVFAATYGLWRYHVLRGDLPRAIELSDRLTEMAEDLKEESMHLEALRAAGCTLVHAGKYQEAEVALLKGIQAYSADRHRSNAYVYGHDPATTFYVYRAVNLWLLGFPDRAEATIDALHSLLTDSNHRLSVAYAWTMGAQVSQLTGRVDRVLAIAKKGLELAREGNLPMFRAFADTQYGWALAETGEVEAGIDLISTGLERWEAIGGGAYRAYMRGILADVHRRHGSVEVAAELLRYAERDMEEGGEKTFEAEIFRLQGEVAADCGDNALAENLLDKARQIAQGAGSLALELRVAISSVRVPVATDASELALSNLSEVYRRFSEGFDTADLLTAARLIGNIDP